MATLAEIEQAIRNADKAGRKADVQALAAERQRILSQGGGATAPSAAGDPPSSTSSRLVGANVDEIRKRVEGQAADTRATMDVIERDRQPWWWKPIQAIGDAATVAGHGLSMGYDEKARAGIKTLLNDQSYDQNLAESKRATEGAYNRFGSPGTALALELATNYKALPARAVQGATLLGRAGLNAIEGAGYGTLSAGGHDENLGAGAAGGAAFGAGGSAAADLIGKATSSLGRLYNEYAADPSKVALQRVYEAARAAGLSNQSIDDFIRRHGPEARGIDILGTAGTDMARGAANRNPAARETLESELETRNEGQNQRILSKIESIAGTANRPDQTVKGLKSDLYDTRREAIDQAYETAKQKGADLPRGPFARILDSPMGRKAYEEAGKRLQNEVAITGNDANSELARLDMTKRVLDDMAGKAGGERMTNEQRQASIMAKQLREAVDAQVNTGGPEYEAARKARRAAYKTEGAVDTGVAAAKPTVPLGTSAKARAADTAADKLAQRQGYALQKRQELLNKPSGKGVLTKMGTPAAKEAQDAVLGPRSPMVSQAVETERMFNKTKNDALTGSTTARQLLQAGVLGGGSAYLLGVDDPTSLLGAAVGTAAGRAGGAKALSTAMGRTMTQALLSRLQRQAAAAAPHIAETLVSSPKDLPLSSVFPDVGLSPDQRNALARVFMQSQLPMRDF